MQTSPENCASRTKNKPNSAGLGRGQLCAAATKSVRVLIYAAYPSDHERTKQRPSLRSGPSWALFSDQDGTASLTEDRVSA